MIRQILMITDKESFASRSIMTALMGKGLAIWPTGPAYSALPSREDCPAAIFMCMQDYKVDRKGYYTALKDLIRETGALFFLAGDKNDMADYVLRQFPAEIITEIFNRPFNAPQIAERINRLYEEHLLHPENKERFIAPKVQEQKRVLIVDDDPTSLRALKSALHSMYKVTMSDSGMSALTYLEDHRPDLILLDYEMPILNGPQFLKMVRAREKLRDIPVIFLTGKSDKETVLRVMESKPNGYILKSTPVEEIYKKIMDFFYEHDK